MTKEEIFRTKKEKEQHKDEMNMADKLSRSKEIIDQQYCPIHEVQLVRGKCDLCGGVCYTC